ncbi:MAG: TlpA family protein disulfide reductase, partial [Verrucomicrobiae bacterium]|nr:TlpA family protein disulfide reductase [Verrucomicrobiae bacterium]
SLPPAPSHWLTLRSGARFGLAVESFGPEAIVGRSEALGVCRVPIEHVHLIRTAAPPKAGPGGSFSGWQLVAAPEPAPEGSNGGGSSPLVGKVAPKFDLPLLAGGKFDLSKEKNTIVILDFWATWCGPCVRSLPEMIESFSALDPKRVKFIAVNQAEPPETIKAFLKQRGWPEFAIALDGNQSVGRNYGVEGIPHTVVIGPDCKIASVSTGFRPGGAAELAELAKKLLDGDKP